MKSDVTIPYYDPYKSYEENYQNGPFGDFSRSAPAYQYNRAKQQLFGLTVNMPFGIPAGPLLNSRFIESAFAWGYDLCVYKTVRSQARKSHPLPNILAVHPQGKLTGKCEEVLADTNYQQPLSITNSFGVPSFEPDIWQPDMTQANQFAKNGQYVIGSFQGTAGKREIIDDYGFTAKLVAETGVSILEANLSCPNEGSAHLLCFDIPRVERIVHAIKNQVPDKPLILKTAYFHDQSLLVNFVKRIAPLVEGISTINTLSATLIDAKGKPALVDRIEGGVCGDAIKWAGLDMVNRLAKLRQELDQQFVIIGVGGVSSRQDFDKYMTIGADVVMSATGSMWNPQLALDIITDI